MPTSLAFSQFFELATGRQPYPYQARLAEGATWPVLLDIPTGLGKTAAVVLAWLWRRHYAPDQTPRRLVYCLPMRVLGEQTREAAASWIGRLSAAGELAHEPGVHLMMGGEIDHAWAQHPDRDAIIIGTQDQLLSRALNRGYTMSRYAWPIHFAWLNDDVLWVADEVQLMGAGAVTMAQLAGLRSRWQTWGPHHTLWMSATLDDRSLATVDFQPPGEGFVRLSLNADDQHHPAVVQRTDSRKALAQATLQLDANQEKRYAEQIAQLAQSQHNAGTLTLIIVNRVPRAQAIYSALVKAQQLDGPALALIHARMRPGDRKRHEEILLGASPNQAGRIVVATQAIEAGVDVSAATLITELAPWSSLVQRFGRCNRYGEQSDAKILWVDIDHTSEKLALPYEGEQIARAREYLNQLSGEAGPAALRRISTSEPRVFHPVIRARDVLDLFDTTPDLDGADLDVARYIRDANDNDVEVAWRTLGDAAPQPDTPFPSRDERCRVGIEAFRTFLKKSSAWVWDPLEASWSSLDARSVRPGLVVLLDTTQGGYTESLGWTGESKHLPAPIEPEGPPERAAADDRDTYTSNWLSLADHTGDVVRACDALVQGLCARYPSLPWEQLQTAARYHDWGKAHPAFQTMLGNAPHTDTLWAKSGGSAPGGKVVYRDELGRDRPGFRHEVASALAYLQHTEAADDASANLVAYLIAAHHGKVRTILRPAPTETMPPDAAGNPYARGVWHGDTLPAADLGGGHTKPSVSLNLGLVQLGEGSAGPSWTARSLALLNEWGPFRLAHMEALLRTADARGSAQGREGLS